MPVYNLYFMNDRGHIDHIKRVEALSDDAMIGSAHDHQGRQPVEIWCEHRKVHRFEAIPGGEARGRDVLEQWKRYQDGLAIVACSEG